MTIYVLTQWTDCGGFNDCDAVTFVEVREPYGSIHLMEELCEITEHKLVGIIATWVADYTPDQIWDWLSPQDMFKIVPPEEGDFVMKIEDNDLFCNIPPAGYVPGIALRTLPVTLLERMVVEWKEQQAAFVPATKAGIGSFRRQKALEEHAFGFIPHVEAHIAKLKEGGK